MPLPPFLRVICVSALLFVMVCTSGCGPVPGGALSGIATRTPNDWSMFLDDDHAICEIESRPSDPHSIQLDCFAYDGQLHVQSHRWALSAWWPVESWAAIWILEPEVRVRFGQQIFDVHAHHVSDPVGRTKVLGFRGYDPVPVGIAVFRFEARGT